MAAFTAFLYGRVVGCTGEIGAHNVMGAIGTPSCLRLGAGTLRS